jgi:hypothetical protein
MDTVPLSDDEWMTAIVVGGVFATLVLLYMVIRLRPDRRARREAKLAVVWLPIILERADRVPCLLSANVEQRLTDYAVRESLRGIKPEIVLAGIDRQLDDALRDPARWMRCITR